MQDRARAEGRGTDELLVLYVLERFLYRLSIFVHRDRLVLKGGMLLAVFEERRPTRDVDLLGMAIANDAESVAALVTETPRSRSTTASCSGPSSSPLRPARRAVHGMGQGQSEAGARLGG